MTLAAPAVAGSLPRLALAWLSAHASVVFGESRVAGLLCLAATALYPRVLLGGLGAILLVEAVFALLALPEISRPAARLNALLAGLAVAALWSPGLTGGAWWIAYPLAVLLAIGLSLWLGELLWQVGHLPALSLPFSLSIWVVMPVLGGLAPAIPALPAFIATESPAGAMLTAFGWIFLSPHPLSGLLVLAALLFASRWLFLLAVAGYAVGQIAMINLAPHAMGPGYAFNYPLAAMAVGGFYCRPGLGSFVLALFAAVLAALGSAAFAHAFGASGVLSLSVPFVAATLLVLATVRHARRGVIATLAYPAPPERQAEAARLARARLGAPGSLPLAPPFHGEWQVYQGFDGAHTHRGPWRHALDFFITDDGQSFRNDGGQLSDYLCFGLPVLAPVAGEVVVARDGLPDNPPGHADTKENWGNHVVIRAADGSHVWLAHLRQDSVGVTAGKWVRVGDIVGACGNSGRSPQPHLHLHVQAGIAAGAASLPFHLDNVLLRAVSPAPTFPHPGGDEPEWRLACVPAQGERVQAARTDLLLAGALALPVGRRLGFEVREGAGEPRPWTAETTLTLAGQLRLTGERASLGAVAGPHVFALYDRQGRADPWLDLFALALGLTPLAEARDWGDAPPARLLPATFAARVALWFGRPLGCALSSRYRRERLVDRDLWRQRGRHELQVAPGWREVFETEADIAPASGIVRIVGRMAGRVMEMRLTSVAQTPDQGIPAWQVEVAANPSQSETREISTMKTVIVKTRVAVRHALLGAACHVVAGTALAAGEWSTTLGGQAAYGAYSSADQRDSWASAGVVLSADYLEKGGYTLGVTHASIKGAAGTADIAQNALFASGRLNFTPDSLRGRLTARLDLHAIGNDDATGDTDGVRVVAPQVSYLSFDKRSYVDLGYARSTYRNSLSVNQWTPAVGFGFNQGADWLRLRGWFIDPSNAARAQGKDSTTALETKWTHWLAPNRLGIDNLKASLLLGERVYAVDADAGSVANLADIQRGGASLGAEWKVGRAGKLLLQLGQDRYRNATLADDYKSNYGYLWLSTQW